MKIAHVITRMILGGAQENTLLSCVGLANKGHDVTLIAGPQTGPEGSLWNEAENAPIQCVKLPTLLRQPAPLQDLRCVFDLQKLFSDQQFDVVHTHSSKAGILARWAAHRAHIPIVVHTIHGMSFNRTQSPPVSWLYRTLEQFVAPMTTAYVSVADAMTTQAVTAGLGPPSGFTTIRSGMDTSQYVPRAGREEIRRAWGISDSDIVVGTIARLFRNKGYDELIEAMPTAAAANPNLRYVWVGDGPGRDAYLARLRSLGLADRVHLTGLVRPDRIPQLIAGFDILVHASKWEGLPRALVQAMLMEIPCIAFDLDGAPEIVIPNETGMLVDTANTSGLTDSIIELAANSTQRQQMGQAGRQRCLEAFDVRTMVNQLDQLYTALASNHRNP